MWIWISIILVILGYKLYKYAMKDLDYFERPNQRIKYMKALPIFGSDIGIFYRKEPLVKAFSRYYEKMKNERIYGSFTIFNKPVITIIDPKIAKQLMTREFEHFIDHQSFGGSADPLFDKTLVALKGHAWKDMRSTLSPAFTGSKMRLMFDFINDISRQYITTMRDEIKKSGNIDFEFAELTRKFTVDVIASCAFGIEVNSFADPNNSFIDIATKVTNVKLDWKQILKFFGFMFIPKVMKMVGVQLFDPNLNILIRDVAMNTMKTREEKGIIRHDMINLLMQAKKGQLEVNNNNSEEKIADGFATAEEFTTSSGATRKVWDDDDMAAQCLIFFLAGFSTVSQTLSFCAYEITCNPDIQQKLYEEISDMEYELNGEKLTYEKIQAMKYLDQVVSETLRHWPIAGGTERICVKDYDLKFDDGGVFHFAKDTQILAPVYSFHHDPRYFSNPEKFDPDRFSEENRKSIDPDTFMPFGIGPRNCIGSRFALMEMKTILYHLILNFSFEVIEKTQIPFKYEETPFAQRPINGFWIGLKSRN